MSKKKKNYYAVAKGRKPGIYNQWFGEGGAEEQVKGFQGAKYKGFFTLEEAQEWLTNNSVDNLENSLKKFINKKDKESKSKSEPKPIFPVPTLKDNEFIIYTDGACKINPGPGGYGTVIIDNKDVREFSGGYKLTTNNRMELTACIVGLEKAPLGGNITLYSDSKYVVEPINKDWIKRWESNNWKVETGGEERVNTDLWKKLINLKQNHTVKFKWVKGHAGNPGNERCDILAATAAARKNLPPDDGYKPNTG